MTPRKGEGTCVCALLPGSQRWLLVPQPSPPPCLPPPNNRLSSPYREGRCPYTDVPAGDLSPHLSASTRRIPRDLHVKYLAPFHSAVLTYANGFLGENTCQLIYQTQPGSVWLLTNKYAAGHARHVKYILMPSPT